MKQSNAHVLVTQLKAQQENLGMSYQVIAKKSGVSEPTVKRIMSGKGSSDGRFDNYLSIADALGVSLKVEAEPSEALKRKQAEKKAAKLLKIVRGSSSLEGQSISKSAYNRMLNETIYKILTGSKSVLWAD